MGRLVILSDMVTFFIEECTHCCLRAEDGPPEAKRNILQANHSSVEMKGQFVRFVTLNCSPQHPEAFILLTPTPKNCHADPLRVFMSQLCLRATARSHFNYHTPLSCRREHAVSKCVCMCVCASIVRVYTHACIHICHCCVMYAVCIYLPFLKRQ